MGAEDALRRQRNLAAAGVAARAASSVALVEGRHAELSQRLKEEGEKLCPTILHGSHLAAMAVLAPSSGEEPASSRHRAGVASNGVNAP